MKLTGASCLSFWLLPSLELLPTLWFVSPARALCPSGQDLPPSRLTSASHCCSFHNEDGPFTWFDTQPPFEVLAIITCFLKCQPLVQFYREEEEVAPGGSGFIFALGSDLEEINVLIKGTYTAVCFASRLGHIIPAGIVPCNSPIWLLLVYTREEVLISTS